MPSPETLTSLYEIESGTELSIQVYKPHAGKIQVVGVASDGRYCVIGNMDWDLHVDDLIERNAAGDHLVNVPGDHLLLTREAWNARADSE